MPKVRRRKRVRWVGPFKLRKLLENCLDDSQPWPQNTGGVYVVSKRAWRRIPKKEAGVLYAGGNTSQAEYLFLTRVGSLIADMLGFWWHHTGGQSLWRYCRKKGIHPLDLYLGWVKGIPCGRCAEMEIYRKLKPELCKRTPAGCAKHFSSRCLCLP